MDMFNCDDVDVDFRSLLVVLHEWKLCELVATRGITDSYYYFYFYFYCVIAIVIIALLFVFYLHGCDDDETKMCTVVAS